MAYSQITLEERYAISALRKFGRNCAEIACPRLCGGQPRQRPNQQGCEPS